ncbi:hypothetical protein SN13_23435 [Vibrio alginolyticus]|uniref:hypothetical protein n=1 Tax=Vibrio alginolyticus TaxID=663 RepID=UPI0005ACF24F|nr:hypothetical protein [Vibrio alginolyticus]EGQ9234501.1 hypothetical protein [Vibrio alginolyticus]ELI1597894.1 hypothetical protein [Vibrio alginolyticus]KIP68197.1 hypothetical protein SN12_20150 [Vibrio alginolyticus]KIP78138.1 hypothetical protein SN13_23435 [Vibrio alginolyticus]
MSKIGNSSASLKFRLPEFSNTFSALWVPVYLEPITFSGERITIGLVFRAIDGTIKVVNTLPFDALNKVFGSKGSDLHSLANFVLTSFDAHVRATNKFETFVPNVKGVFIGEPVETFDKDLESIIYQVRKNYSVFSALFISGEDGITRRTESQAKVWANTIKTETLQLRPTLSNNFNREFKFREGAKAASIGYVGNNIAFNFGALDPDSSSFSLQQNRIIRQATELNSLNKLGMSDFNHLEVNVWTPPKEKLTKASKSKLYSVSEELEQLGDDIDIRIALGQDYKRVTKRIITDSSLQ